MRKVSDMTVEELEQLLERVVEQKLAEYWGDPDEGLELTEWIKRQLKESMAKWEAGERGISLDEFVEQIRKRRGKWSK